MYSARVTPILMRMADMTRQSGLEDWAGAFDRLRLQVAADTEGARINIRALFGGMGSLNDLVLQRDGIALVVENDEFDMLREELYQLCRHA